MTYPGDPLFWRGEKNTVNVQSKPCHEGANAVCLIHKLGELSIRDRTYVDLCKDSVDTE